MNTTNIDTGDITSARYLLQLDEMYCGVRAGMNDVDRSSREAQKEYSNNLRENNSFALSTQTEGEATQSSFFPLTMHDHSRPNWCFASLRRERDHCKSQSVTSERIERCTTKGIY